jgi:ATP-dependent DNA helicase RecG
VVNHEALMKLIAGGESETVELKVSFDKEVVETAGAFANTRGGVILIGVSDARKVLGIQTGKETLKDWANQISHGFHSQKHQR